MNVKNQNNGLTLKAYQGDAKTLLAFNLTKVKAKDLAGFTIQVLPDAQPSYYLYNSLQFEDPTKHAQDPNEPPNSSINAPIHKFRWVHVPGLVHQGTRPFFGPYTYTVTPRYFDAKGSLQAIDPALSVAVTLDVGPFAKGKIETGFTRGFIQSQAFVHHFGLHALFRPKSKDLLFDTAQVSGKNDAGVQYTFLDEYDWLGFTAREKIRAVLDEVLANAKLRLNMFAYDLNEPDVLKALLELAKQGRVRLILDNAALHHNTQKPKPEDQLENLFTAAAKAPAEIKRGHFGRYAHDKVLIVSDDTGAQKVLTGSTNFSITGVYVNSNHVLVFADPQVAGTYADVFNAVWDGKVSVKFKQTEAAGKVFAFATADVPKTEITFSPHQPDFAQETLDNMAARIAKEEEQTQGSVLFAVMGLDTGTGPVLPALKKLHANQNIFSYGISDTPGGIFLYTRRRKTGVLVTGKPVKTRLPPPFDQVPTVGLGHQIHHKFVVCGFNGKKPVVYCGSSNLALGGEEANGDNLIAIYDTDLATVFAIEALALVDHFDFLDRSAANAKKDPTKIKNPSKEDQAIKAGWFLSTSDRWSLPYFDKDDLHYVDRRLFA
jgi:PLD-like domain